MRARQVKPWLVVVALVAVAVVLVWWRPEAARRGGPQVRAVTVETLKVVRQDFPLKLRGEGFVRSRYTLNLNAEVSGVVLTVAENALPGSDLKAGDWVLQIEPRSYQLALSRALAEAASARLGYLEEQSRAEQAVADWRRLQGNKPVPDMIARVPHLEAARAAWEAAREQVAWARWQLEKTWVRVPFDAEILALNVSPGQRINAGEVLGQAIDRRHLEVRLPLPAMETGWLESRLSDGLKVELVSAQSGRTWTAIAKRLIASLNDDTRQTRLIADLVDSDDAPRVGEFVHATIDAGVLPQALVVPESSVYENTFVYVVEGQQLQRRPVHVLWRDGEQAIIGEGLEENSLLVVTPLGNLPSGTPVVIKGSEADRGRRQRREQHP